MSAPTSETLGPTGIRNKRLVRKSWHARLQMNRKSSDVVRVASGRIIAPRAVVRRPPRVTELLRSAAGETTDDLIRYRRAELARRFRRIAPASVLCLSDRTLPEIPRRTVAATGSGR